MYLSYTAAYVGSALSIQMDNDRRPRADVRFVDMCVSRLKLHELG